MSLNETLLIIGAWIVIAWAVAVRLGAAIRRHHAAAVPPYARFTPPPPGARYLACDTTICAHLAIVHTRQTDGTWRCSGCGHTKGD